MSVGKAYALASDMVLAEVKRIGGCDTCETSINVSRGGGLPLEVTVAKCGKQWRVTAEADMVACTVTVRVMSPDGTETKQQQWGNEDDVDS